MEPSSSPRAPVDASESSRAFSAWEGARLTELAAVDPRLALRLGTAPGDSDPFAFDARAWKLEAIAGRIANRPRAQDASSEERELLTRLVAEEQVRVEEERRLPQSGSELVRALVATWTTPSSMKDLREHDAWLASKEDEILAALQPSCPLSATQVVELEDALDPLERLATPAGYPATQGAIARLRVALGASRPAPEKGLGWDELHRRLVVHLGIADSQAALREEVAGTEARLRAEAGVRLSSAGETEARKVLKDGGEGLSDGVCKAEAGPPSGVRGLGPSPERAFVCMTLRELASGGPEADLRAVVDLHDAVTIASWAFAIHVDGVDPVEAPHGRPLLGELPPERQGRLVRLAAVRPVACIAVARMALLLDSGGGGPEGRRERAKRWLARGDAPLDLVQRGGTLL